MCGAGERDRLPNMIPAQRGCPESGGGEHGLCDQTRHFFGLSPWGHHAAMTFPVDSGGGDRTGPPGYTYAGVVVRLDGAPSGRACTREDVLAALREIRFSGWLAQPEGGWLVAVAASGDATVAAGRRGVVGVGEWLADRLAATVLAIRVMTDRQLLVALWVDREEVGRYVSDPSYGLDADDDTLSNPLGVEHAAAFAAACGRP